MSEERLSYRFGPLERRGLLGPVRGGQAALLACGLGFAALLLDLLPSATGAFLALLTLALATGLGTAPLAGRALDEWAPVVGAHLLRVAGGRRRLRPHLPAIAMGAQPRTAGAGRPAAPATPLPATLRGVSLLALETDGRRLGVARELHGRRLTAVLACQALSFTLLDPAAQERRLAQWGLVLAGCARGPVRRLQWVERTAPARGDELAHWLHEARDPAIPPRGAPIIESYLELIGSSTRVANDHEVLLAVQVDGRLGRGRHERELESILMEELARLARGLEAAEIRVLGALGAGQLARALRTAYDPYARAELSALESADPGRGEDWPQSAGPLAAEEHWDHYRCDGAWHASFWIGGWPRVDVSPMFMDALLGSSDTVRTVAVTFEPVPPDRSTREVEAAITRDRADNELRRRFGQSETARQRQAQEAAMRREAELAAGHAEVRLAGFVTVSGRDEADLRAACAEVQQQAARSRLELRRMYGQQAEAFSFTLPLARGLR
ncbi:MAG: SCO6880 family protein [Solirubrobacteraceae bacterium]